MVLTFGLNGVSLYPHGAANFTWNLGLRFVAVSIVVVVIAGARRAYVREWWLARTDVLTKALNRQAFFELAPSVIGAHRWRLLVYADLDGMKTVNDVHGHAAGDACLRAFGATVRSMIRRNDIFARVGGDEFLIYMSVKDESAAKAVARRLHETMNGVTVESGLLKCSVGGLIVPPGEASIDYLVRSADSLMYEAKLRGASLQVGTAPDGELPRLGHPSARMPSPPLWAPPWTRRERDRRADGGSEQALPWMLRW
jgi:diguanylate cyclase (GGDEF)-like protein